MLLMQLTEMETQWDENSLSLLSVNIRVAENGELSTKFYEKSAKQGVFVHAQSAIPSQMKTSALRAKYNRMQKLSSTHTDQEVARHQFCRKMLDNGY